MTFHEHIPLAPYSTFKIGGPARFFCVVSSAAELKEAIQFAHEKPVPFFILGGGSNILISDNGFDGLVIKMEIGGKKIQDSRSSDRTLQYPQGRTLGSRLQRSDLADIIVSVGAGEVWDDFVAYTVENRLSGLENLSAIPGTVGAAPVQNIGAYGVEVASCISAVHALDTHTMSEVSFLNKECLFAYRDSLFKHEKGRYIITHVDFILKNGGQINIEYKDLKEYFEKKSEIRNPTSEENSTLEIQFHSALALRHKNSKQPTPQQVREAVIEIRRNKLPDWHAVGTAGSFFKNPIISLEKYHILKNTYPELPGFIEPISSAADAQVQKPMKIKIPLGWVLDHVCHMKGVMKGSVGTYDKQALVIIVKPGVTAREVTDFADYIARQVEEVIGIRIETEVERVG
jgi:UDP-N-acetylmuramate dehydrogenase